MLSRSAKDHQSDNDWFDSIFSSPPIAPLTEAAAYESLWTEDGAWFKNVAALFEKNPGLTPSELVTPAIVDEARLKLTELLGKELLAQLNVAVHGAGDYPDKLREADHPVELLYYLGNWDLVESPAVAVVGTRNPSPEGIEHAQRIARILVKNDYTVVSGLAQGIDTAAHTAALEAGGRTIAVIGTPVFDVYPKENAGLQERIAREHLVISQVPFLRYKRQSPRTNRLFFPARNVTMSALTQATVIVEAGNTSGTLVQARAALKQGRKLFILDSCFRNSELTWPAKYEAEGAIRVTRPSQIIEELARAAIPKD
nr:DNA-processing protein DprA [Dyella sp. ASV24]